MGSFSTKGYIQELRKRQKMIAVGFGRCVLSIHAQHVTRVFDDGKNAAGGAIGKYSESYKKLRRKRGRQTGFVDLKLEGNLRLDYSNGGRPTKLNELLFQTGTKRKENSVKVDGLEDRYGSIFALTDRERESLKQCAERERAKIGV